MKKLKVLDMCNSCINNWKLREKGCDAQVRYAEELVPDRMLQNIGDRNAVIACSEYEEYEN